MKYAILAMLVLLLAGCPSTEEVPPGGDARGEFPGGATDIQYEGNNWVSFKWHGSCFLMQKNGVFWGNSFDRAFTSYDCPKEAAE